MNDEARKEIILFRYAILAPLISGTYDEHLSVKEFFVYAAKKVYTNPCEEDTKASA